LASLADKIKAVRIEPVNISGPLALAVGSDISDNIYLMAKITASHCKKGSAGNIKLEVSSGSKKEYIDLEPKDRDSYRALRL
ncbi:MAG: hypothetical protein PHQ54_03405, partial [Candidatus Omnitrophica bacterium]|nr:hypothetical protein [Candidatus Omnitrophota bacterium]